MTGPRADDLAIPWRDPDAWTRAVDALEHLVRTREASLLAARALAVETQAGLERVFPLLDALCRETCSRCPAPCCLHAAVYADFRDLLFFSLTGTKPPETQLRRSIGDTCRFLSNRGCRLPRLQRPWICTWYLCADQQALLDSWPDGPRQDLREGLERIRGGRKRMEEAFLVAVT